MARPLRIAFPGAFCHINGAYTTYFNVKHARAGHLFQVRYKAILVEMDEYAKELSCDPFLLFCGLRCFCAGSLKIDLIFSFC